jgi:L-ascorbate metabolism protein UlaG (beta-lactamase superfamily)
MELTKHAHACVTLGKGDGRIVIDPGAFTPNAAELVAGSDAVLITHEHFDHFDKELITAALRDRPELTVYGPAAVASQLGARPGQIVAVAGGDQFTAVGFEITVHGDLHAVIHRDILPLVANVGYLIDGSVHHPGDAYHVPPVPVETLLMPTSGPWTSVAQAAEYLRAVKPRQSIQIHEVHLSGQGQETTARFLGPGMLGPAPLHLMAPGETAEV